MNFPERLQTLMDLKKIDQKTVAESIGFERAQVSKWLSGVVGMPRRTTLQKLSFFFSCDINWLATGDGEPFPATQELPQTAEETPVAYSTRPVPSSVLPARKNPPVTGDPPPTEMQEEWSISEMLLKTTTVLESKTVYRSALASNVRAFYQAVQKEDEMTSVSEKLEAMQAENRAMAERMARMEEMLLSLGASQPRKREQAGG